MTKQNNPSVHEEIIKSVSKLCVKYIRKYNKQILGIYLSPYRVGGMQRIEVVIVDNNKDPKNNITLSKRETQINDLKILFNTQSTNNYKRKTSAYNYKLLRDLNYGSIIYDTNNELLKIKSTAINDEQLIEPINSYQLPTEFTKLLKRRIYTYRRKK